MRNRRTETIHLRKTDDSSWEAYGRKKGSITRGGKIWIF